MICDWPQNGPQIKQIKKTLCGDDPDPKRRGEGGGEGGKPPPELGGLGGSDWKGEKIGGSEEKKGDLLADLVARRIIYRIIYIIIYITIYIIYDSLSLSLSTYIYI